MSGQRYLFKYRFHPVGQGLFSSGVIWNGGADEIRFLWVYDCGTSSSQKLIDAAIYRLRGAVRSRKCIELVTISHFDRDHISGIERLIECFKIGTLMLPYMPLAQRLMLAFEEGVEPSDELIRFFINPVEYLTALEGPGIERILFVRPSGENGPPVPESPPRSPDDADHDFDLDFDPEKPSDRDELELLSNASRTTRLDFLRKGSGVRIHGLWEFVPYNDDDLEKGISNRFRDMIDSERSRLVGGSSRRTRNNALRRLRKLYDEQFGNSSEKRNVISLFLYGGPIYSSWMNARLLYSKQSDFGLPSDLYDLSEMMRWQEVRRNPSSPSRCSMLYTGDGYLDWGDRLQRLRG